MNLYIHLPFCKKKCNYCDFVSFAGKEDLIDDYVKALCREPAASPTKGRDGVRSIYFGGGTPTLLEPRHFERILTNVGAALVAARTKRTGTSPVPTLEISSEANPKTANKAKLSALRQLGINRLSIGAQSFNDQHLQRLGRIHTAKDTLKFYDDARRAGFDNINLDLIFALPNQTLAEWKKDLQTAMALNPEHLSTYNLQIEAGTLFYQKYKQQDDESELAMYEYTIETLKAAGFKHYEISNFAKPGFECRHNINYWQNGNYLGLGAGAHSHVNGKRWANPNCIEAYIKTPSSFLPLDKGENVERSETRGGETIFLGLRLLDGLHEDNFRGFEKEIVELRDSKLLTKKGLRIKLTRKGLYLANEVFARFI